MWAPLPGTAAAFERYQTAPYGEFTPYQTLTPGFYTVAMRPAGAAAATEPMLSAPVTVDKGKAYTLLATGTRDALKTSLIDDDLTKPPTDTSRVRLVQGSTAAPTLTVTAVGGPTLSRDLAYGQGHRIRQRPAGPLDVAGPHTPRAPRR